MEVNDEGEGEEAWMDAYRKVQIGSSGDRYLKIKMAHIAKGEWHKIDQEMRLLFEAS